MTYNIRKIPKKIRQNNKESDLAVILSVICSHAPYALTLAYLGHTFFYSFCYLTSMSEMWNNKYLLYRSFQRTEERMECRFALAGKFPEDVASIIIIYVEGYPCGWYLRACVLKALSLRYQRPWGHWRLSARLADHYASTVDQPNHDLALGINTGNVVRYEHQGGYFLRFFLVNSVGRFRVCIVEIVS